MIPIFLGRTGTNSGHTLLAWSLGQAIKDRGLRLGIFKPYGTLRNGASRELKEARDRDVVLLAKVLEIEDPIERICPLVFPSDSPPLFSQEESRDFEEKVKENFQLLSQDKDVVILLGSQGIFFDSGLPGFPDSRFIKLFNARILLVDSYKEDHTSTYSILSVSSLLKEHLQSVVLNRIPAERLSQVEGSLVPFLEEKGIHVSALIPEDRILAARSLSGIAHHLDATILSGQKELDRFVERATIDTSCLGDGFEVLRKMRTRILLLGGRGKDLDQSESAQQLVGIVITSGRMPGDPVEDVAKQNGIPLLQVNEDTFTTLERLDHAPCHLSAEDEVKVERFRALLDKKRGMGDLLDRFLK